MQAKINPMTKTAIDLRRGIARLEAYREANPHLPQEELNLIDHLISDLKEVRSHIPAIYVDADLKEA